MERIFRPDSPVMHFFQKTGELIILSICWLTGCIPVVTIGTSTAALYYAVVKSVRKDTGYPAAEFWRAYKYNLKRGTEAFILAAAVMLLLYINRETLANGKSAAGIAGVVAYDLIFVLAAGVLVYLFPVLSRFSFKLTEGLKLSFVMAVRFLPMTVLMGAGTIVLFILWLRFLPIPFIAVIPAVWCFVISFFMEKALLRFMPKPEEGDMSWYFN